MRVFVRAFHRALVGNQIKVLESVIDSSQLWALCPGVSVCFGLLFSPFSGARPPQNHRGRGGFKQQAGLCINPCTHAHPVIPNYIHTPQRKHPNMKP